MIPKTELLGRISRLQKEIRSNNISGALIVQRADLYYFCGTGQNGHLFVPAEGEPRLLVKKNLQRAKEESSLDLVIPFAGWDELKQIVIGGMAAGEQLGMELDVLPVNLYFRYRKSLHPLTIVDISFIIRQIRSIKTPFEIRQLKAAAALAWALFAYARDIIKEGMTEAALAAELESFTRCRGHQGAVRMRGFNQEMFYGHVMSGESAAAPSFFDGPTGGHGLNPSYPQGAGLRKIRRNEPILIDYVTVLDGYMVDQTRIFCLGRLPEALVQAYGTALRIKSDLIALGKAGSCCAALFRHAENLAAQAGLLDHFMGAAEKVSFIGHGVGLELDELPVIARGAEAKLGAGMVFALEPKFIFPGEGVVGIEDTFLVTESGLAQITSFDDSIQYL
ncbi:MAG: Xaa-Pro peptidase family protein [Bacillota bacterium]